MDLGKLNISVEDRFIILQLNVEDNLLPHGNTLDRFSHILSSLDDNYEIICDFREVKYITSDLQEFIEKFEFHNSKLLVNEDSLDFFQTNIRSGIKIFPVDRFETKFKETSVDLTAFADHHSIDAFYPEYKAKLDQLENQFSGLPNEKEYQLFLNYDGLGIDNKPYYKNFQDYIDNCKMSKSGVHLGEDLIFPRRYLEHLIKNIRSKSLLSQFCIIPDQTGAFSVNSFQSNAINTIETVNKKTLAKPYIYSKQTDLVFQKVLFEFQNLINNKNVKEGHFQKFFENNPVFLEVLGYKTVYPQVILERDDGTSLRPDFLLEPIGDDWWDILDIKLPDKKLIIDSNKDRFRYSASVTELQAQLREYSAFFDDEKYQKRVEEKYGIKCYRPKMIGVIGNFIDSNDERQVRRLMTSYTDLKIMTFDQLYRVSKERLLI